MLNISLVVQAKVNRPRHCNDGAQLAPRMGQKHRSHAQSGIGVGAEVNGITKVINKAGFAKNETPEANLCHVQEEHEENCAAKDKRSQPRVPSLFPQDSGSFLIMRHDAFQSSAV